MLKSLNIDNYAIISDLHIEWSDSLNIVTGQTGAGKSIILGALSLLSGNKADASFLLDKERNLVVEGAFEIKGYGLESFFEDNDIDYSNDIIIRRQISPSGKSRCFIEDVPVPQSVLSSLAERLIDVHSQNQSLLLSKEDFQIDLLDSIAATQDLRKKCKDLYLEYMSSKIEANNLREEVGSILKEADFLSYQIEQIDALKLSEGDINTLEERLSVIEHSEDIAKALSETYSLLDGQDNSISSTLQTLSKVIRSNGKYMDKLNSLSDRLESSAIELKDISEEADNILSSLSFDEDEKNRVESRLDEIYTIMSKHNVSSENGLLELNAQMKERLQSIEAKQDLLVRLDDNTLRLFNSLSEICNILSDKRKESLSAIEDYVVKSISKLGIEKGKFTISMTSKQPSSNGSDEVKFLFSANRLSPLQPIGKTASGGETSRLMLALKSLAAKSLKLPTIIFDEIDTGVSGAIADAMGNMIDEMSHNMQVINITHLPQVAAKGENHFEVFKMDSRTSIVKLTKQQRINKIAEMISGANISDAAIRQAKLLLGYQ